MIIDEKLLGQLLGPVGLTVALIVAVVFVVRELFKFVRAYIDDLKATVVGLNVQLKAALDGWQEQTKANQTLADAQAARNRDDEMRHRLADEERKKVS